MNEKISQELIKFIKSERVCSLAVTQSNGQPHCAAMLYSFTLNPLKLIFMTESNSKKASLLLQKKKIIASVVVGLTEKGRRTVQMTGVLQMFQKETEINEVKDLFYGRYSLSEEYETDKSIFLTFSPNWIRDTKYLQKGPKINQYNIK